MQNYDFAIRLAQANVPITLTHSFISLMSLLHPRPTLSKSSGITRHIKSTHMGS